MKKKTKTKKAPEIRRTNCICCKFTNEHRFFSHKIRCQVVFVCIYCVISHATLHTIDRAVFNRMSNVVKIFFTILRDWLKNRPTFSTNQYKTNGTLRLVPCGYLHLFKVGQSDYVFVCDISLKTTLTSLTNDFPLHCNFVKRSVTDLKFLSL